MFPNPRPCMTSKRSAKFLLTIDLHDKHWNFFGGENALSATLPWCRFVIPISAKFTHVPFMFGMIAIVTQLISVDWLIKLVEKKDIRNGICWLSVTIVTSVIYVICVAAEMIPSRFSGVGALIIFGVTLFKIYELNEVFAYIQQLDRCQISSVAASISHPTQFQVVLPYGVVADLPPSYFETQNRPECAEPPPPCYEEVIISKKKNECLA
ncbi:unnamed protein product [Orchesella dallaii]|uniref:Uncharacterized protein n=1 Tax=Orchesella dallaii TaxID=48710 RepID=A0ABP1PZS7_9HEXA